MRGIVVVALVLIMTTSLCGCLGDTEISASVSDQSGSVWDITINDDDSVYNIPVIDQVGRVILHITATNLTPYLRYSYTVNLTVEDDDFGVNENLVGSVYALSDGTINAVETATVSYSGGEVGAGTVLTATVYSAPNKPFDTIALFSSSSREYYTYEVLVYNPDEYVYQIYDDDENLVGQSTEKYDSSYLTDGSYLVYVPSLDATIPFSVSGGGVAINLASLDADIPSVSSSSPSVWWLAGLTILICLVILVAMFPKIREWRYK